MNAIDMINKRVEKFLMTRKGLNSKDLLINVRNQMTGIVFGAITDYQMTPESFCAFLDKVETHEIDPNKLVNSKGFFLEDFVDESILNDPWFKIVRDFYYYLKPGNSQAGPLEFLLCFLAANSEYVRGAQSGCDVIIGGVKIEIKTHGSQKTATVDKLNFYETSDECDLLMIAKPSTATLPMLMASVDFRDGGRWTDIVRMNGEKLECLIMMNRQHSKLVNARGLKAA